MEQVNKSTLYYVHDPMCSWCWAFVPTWTHIERALSGHMDIQYLLGGLAPDTDEPMPPSMQKAISGYWKTIEQRVPGTKFNYDFWTKCQPRRATYPSCRAVIAARAQDSSKEKPMIRAIQEGYYLNAQNPSDESTLVGFAETLGLDSAQFLHDLNSESTQHTLQQEIAMGQRIGAQGFPSLILKNVEGYRLIRFDYNQPSVALSQLGI